MMPEFSMHILQTDICIYYMMQNKDRRTDLRIYYMMWEYIRIVFSVHIYTYLDRANGTGKISP